MWERFFSPRGVAIIGASPNPTKLGYGAARNLVVSGYRGAIHFVNPRQGELFGRPFYPRIEDVPDPVDLAVILIPAEGVPEAVEACGRRGLTAAIVGSGGFREVGPDGAALEQRLLDSARRSGVRLIGPNCIGLLDTHFPVDTTFLPLPGPIPGDIAFLSHSGAICEAVIDWARGQGFGLSRLVSLGNQVDLTEADLLGAAADDEHTRVVAMYLEGVGDGPRFLREAGRVSRRKPIVAIKVGRSEAGRRAVASHTGALAGRDAAFDAAFRKAGVLRAETSEEVFDWARALAWCPLPRGPRVAVLTNAGGPAAIGVDALSANGLELAELSSATEEGLRAFLPGAASVRNPIDMLASAGPAEYAAGLDLLLADPGVDSVMIVLPPPPMATATDVAGAIIPIVKGTDKPVVLALMGEDLIVNAARLLRHSRIPDYRFPERAASALRVLWWRARQLAAEPVAAVEEASADAAAHPILDQASPGTDGFVPAEVARRMLDAYGLGGPQSRLAHSASEAVAAAEGIGYPVALKVVSPDLTHKTDVGGVRLDLDTPEAVRQAFQGLTDSVRKARPKARIDGVEVQTMVRGGQEVIVGAVRDEHFGPLLMFGEGGVEVESRRDVAFALAPLSRAEAEVMIDSTWAGRRLSGGRGVAPVDREAALAALLGLSRLMSQHPRIEEVEVNPLRVMERGAQVLDARLKLRTESGSA